MADIRSIPGALIACGFALLLGAGSGCAGSDKPARAPISVDLCLARQADSALLYVALADGDFEAEGLRVNVTEYVSGKRAVQAVLDGKGELGTTAEVPLAFFAARGDSFRILAQINATGRGGGIVARRSAGITAPADLAGKRIGTQRGSAVHFFLHLFLLNLNIPDAAVDTRYYRAEDLAPALHAGEIDALCMREPIVSDAVALLGDDAVVFGKEGIYFRTGHLVASEQFARQRPDAARAVLRALLRAERRVAERRERLAEVLAPALDLDELAVTRLTKGFELRVVLDQGLLVALEDEVAWARAQGLLPAGPMPNFLDHVAVGPLGEVRPRAVTLIH